MGSGTFSTDIAKINNFAQAAIKAKEKDIPGLVFQCVNGSGDVLASAVTGVRDIANSIPMTNDTVFWIASCTKLVTSIACMQLVECGKAELDNPDLIATVLPEVAQAKVLVHGEEKEQERNITLRMLLTHTCKSIFLSARYPAGYSYTFLWEELWNRLGQKEDMDEFQGHFKAFQQPLKFQPGAGREYSIGIDWVGVFIERTARTSLGRYFEENIFKPLGIQSSAMVLSDAMRSNLSSMHTRDSAGKLKVRDHLNKVSNASNHKTDCFHSGGAGLFSTATDYCKILTALLNSGVCPTTSQRILQNVTIEQMFKSQIPEWQNSYAGRGHAICRPDLAVSALKDDVPVTGREGWGLSFLLTGENLQAASAAGLSNCFWALDREKGVAAVLFSQVLPLGDPAIVSLWLELQEIILT